MQLLLLTNPGIEDVVVDESVAKLNAKVVEVREGRGRVIIDVDEDLLEFVGELRSIHRARILLLHTKNVCREKECLENIRELVASLPFYEYINPWTTFAVRAERVGEHEYTSLEIAKVAGDAIIEVVRSKYGHRPPVDLDYPNVIVAIDLIFDELFVSIELGGDLSWHRRGYRVYEHPAALKPTLAYAMIRISGMRDGESLLDPMCGGGTIPIEAAYVFEDAKLYCSDFNPRHVKGAIMNAKAALVDKRIRFFVLDARDIDKKFGENAIDHIVSNPPYGIRLGNPWRVRKVYRKFLEVARKIVNKNIVIITTEHEYVKQIAPQLGYNIVHERVVAHGNLWPKILVLE